MIPSTAPTEYPSTAPTEQVEICDTTKTCRTQMEKFLRRIFFARKNNLTNFVEVVMYF